MLYVPRWKETRYICVVVVGLISATVSTATLFFSVLAISSLSSFTYSLVLVTSSRLHSLLPHLEVALVRFLLLFYYIVNNNFFFCARAPRLFHLLAVCVCVCLCCMRLLCQSVFKCLWTHKQNKSYNVYHTFNFMYDGSFYSFDNLCMLKTEETKHSGEWEKAKKNNSNNNIEVFLRTNYNEEMSKQSPIVHISIFRCFCCSEWSSIYCIFETIDYTLKCHNRTMSW